MWSYTLFALGQYIQRLIGWSTFRTELTEAHRGLSIPPCTSTLECTSILVWALLPELPFDAARSRLALPKAHTCHVVAHVAVGTTKHKIKRQANQLWVKRMNDRANLESLIQEYFEQGYSYRLILCFLSSVHDITISMRTLKRILRRKQLRRRGLVNHANLRDVGSCILVSYIKNNLY